MVNNKSKPKVMKKDFGVICLAYVLALVVAIAVGYVVRGLDPIIIIFIADIAATLVIYLFGRVYRNASFYDAYWSLAPLAIAVYWMVKANNPVIERQIIVVTLVFAWGLRLTWNWARGWHGLKHEDWRYQDFRKQSKNWFWLIDLIGIEIMPTVIVFLACLSLYPALAVGERPLGWLDVIAVIITAGAIFIETSADEQLRNFMRKPPRPGEILAEGLWAYSRHPNYMGEVTFWWGLYIFGLAADPAYWWTIIGPVAVTVLFIFVSIPLVEKRSLERRPGYAEIRKKIPALLPWFPKNRL
jgi:steroid 5-alpha reductase family enzyme